MDIPRASFPKINAQGFVKLVSNNVEFELEFYDEYNGLFNELYELESGVDLLLTEPNISEIELSLVESELERIKSEIEILTQTGVLDESQIKQLEQDFKKEIEEIIAGIKCPKDFKCYKSPMATQNPPPVAT